MRGRPGRRGTLRRVPSVSVTQALRVAPDVAERLWYDTARWAEWVHGLEAVLDVDPGWPSRPGATVTWRSGPAGRGTVRERVIEHRAGHGQRLEIRDDTIEGEQDLAFSPGPDGAQVSLSLDFRRRRRTPLTTLVDVLFARRAVADALAASLQRFAVLAAAPR